MRARPHSLATLLAATLLLSACGGGADNSQQNLDTLDAELTNSTGGNGRDPVLAAALQDQIMVDPALASQANDDAIRPPSQPLSGAVPPDAGGDAKPQENLASAPPPSADCPQCRAARQALTLGSLAQKAKVPSCSASLRYSASYADRLPAALPLYPDARVSEAAGNDANGCAFRAVSFVSSASVQDMLNWYHARARAGGYAAGHQADGSEHVLAGTRDGAAFTLFVTARPGGGSAVDLLANAGR
ncbi:hypothetical protein [Sphingomonas aracearum]|uniref:Uncharacterized protein n=1 Tax=Sphingomonas aracearum TaxID=2283317 RepID=A0A369VX76_9SPHN|nr:hypothetical protein [Sphingomonas aracearum]RDE06187.1 hypothetical protein DVW87_00120 [Sphingomonas aracearum]